MKDPRKRDISGGRRCALHYSEWLSDWWVGISPRNGYNAAVEGDWEDWVELAQNILKLDAEYKELVKAGATFEEPTDE